MRNILLLLLFCAYAGCNSQRERAQVNPRIANFPLEVGTSWTLVSNVYSLSMRVDTVLEIGNRKYACIAETSDKIGSSSAAHRTVYLAQDENMNTLRLCTRDPSQDPRRGPLASAWYKYDANVGDSWTSTANSYYNSKTISQYRITLLSRSDTIVTPVRTFFNCFRFYIDDLYESDSEYGDWICPGTGLVSRSFGNDTSKAFLLRAFIPPK